MGKFNKVSNVLGNSFDQALRSGYVARSVAGAGVGGTIGAVSDGDNRTTGFLTGASIGSGLGAGSRALQGLRPGIRGAATRRMYARSAEKFVGPMPMQGPMPFSGSMTSSAASSGNGKLRGLDAWKDHRAQQRKMQDLRANSAVGKAKAAQADKLIDQAEAQAQAARTQSMIKNLSSGGRMYGSY